MVRPAPAWVLDSPTFRPTAGREIYPSDVRFVKPRMGLAPARWIPLAAWRGFSPVLGLPIGLRAAAADPGRVLPSHRDGRNRFPRRGFHRGRRERRLRDSRHRVRRRGNHPAGLALSPRARRLDGSGGRHGARLQLHQGALPRQVRGRGRDRGACVVAYDHRNFGDSDGEPRQELDPWLQVRDYRHAITFAQTLDGVDPDRVGVWGSSYAGGHVIVVGAIDRRVGCAVAQVPTISGWESTLRRIGAAGVGRAAPGLRRRPARALSAAKRPTMVPMVVDPPPAGQPPMRVPTRGSSSPGRSRLRRTEWRFRKWRNEITLRSLELYSEYEPGSFIERIAPTPLLMVLGDNDIVCPTDLGLEAYNRAREPKRLELFPGGHFSAYTDQFERASRAAPLVHRAPATVRLGRRPG